jgi:asparagine synthase (glutamine-hydrolysing)
MGGFCGWVGAASERTQEGALAAEMLEQGFARDAPSQSPVVARRSAIAARPGVVSAITHRAGALLVALEGRPRWETAELTALAAKEGSGAALAEAYRRYGARCLEHLSGAFALAIVDAERESALVAIDRVGIRSLSYANPSGCLVFGTSVESVAAHPGVGRAVNPQAVFDYLFCHVVPAPRTIFEGIHKLRAGECAEFRNGTLERRFYWQLRYEDRRKMPLGELKPRFRALLREAAARTLGRDAEAGAFLSGGTDSSTVTGLLTELRGKGARTYSIGFGAEGFDEMSYARITARHFAASAHEYYVKPKDVVEAIPVIARSYDEPFGNDSAVPTWYCAKMAQADGVKVMLAGDGGDEIFGGNARYAKQKLFEAYARVPGLLRHGLIEPVAFKLPGGERIAPLRKLASYVRQASLPLPDRLETYNFLQRTPLDAVLEPGFLAAIDPDEPLALEREVYARTASASSLNRMMHLDLQLTLADNDLRKVSRMCEAAGVAARYPLLDDALVAFSGEIPPELKVKGLKLRYFFKRALDDFLPPETLAKTKHGFGMPFGLWLREHEPLAALVRDSLHAFERRGIVKPQYIRELLHRHQVSHATYFGTMIWVVAMLERWLAERRL